MAANHLLQSDGDEMSISASELANLILRRRRRRNGSTKSEENSIIILDCRRQDAFKNGRCIGAENILPPPTLLFHRFKGKPDFWTGTRERLPIPVVQDEENGLASISVVVVAEDEENDPCNNCVTNCAGGSTTNCQRFSSFLISNLIKDGFRTFRLEKGAMTQFLTDYGDLCVFNSSDECDKEQEGRMSNENDQKFLLLRGGSGCGPSSSSAGFLRQDDESSSPKDDDSAQPALSDLRSTTTKSPAPFLLPMLKLKDLTLTSSSSYRPDHDCSSSKITENNIPNKEEDDRTAGSSKDAYSNKYRNVVAKNDFCGNFEIGANSSEGGGGATSANKDRDPVNIYETLYLGNADNASDLDTLRRYNIEYILNVTSDLPNQFESSSTASKPTADEGGGGISNASGGEDDAIFKYLRIPVVDNVSQNLASYFPLANDFIDEAVEHKRGILVHCLAGISRSVTFTVAYLMKVKSCGMDEAYDIVKRRKPNIEPNLNFMRQLLHYERELSSSRSDGSGDLTPDSAVSSLSTSSSSI